MVLPLAGSKTRNGNKAMTPAEILARRICGQPMPCMICRKVAVRCIADLRENRFKILPREPTEAMVEAGAAAIMPVAPGRSAVDAIYAHIDADYAAAGAWRAAWDAA